jgi:ribulose-phosphate 3-epimerase
MRQIKPTISATNKLKFKQEFTKIVKHTNKLHIDIADGRLVAVRMPLYINFLLKQKKANPDLDLSFHLMVKNPARILVRLKRLGANEVFIHPEATRMRQTVDFYSKSTGGIKLGLAITASTKLADIQTEIRKVDRVIIFAGSLGHQGGKANLEMLEVLRKVKNINPNLKYIGWDGGINLDNIEILQEAGVNVFNVGASLSESKDWLKTYHDLTSA